mmetsp:Transcript_32881/g.83457  ORF Transcript_32881/g.83457 Transcript_32881/m.83457 type:complete len:405 (-) Transcript_32881:2077-3291(-)
MGKKYALLVGCNYPGTNAELRGCINDVIGCKAMLTQYFGFTEADITVMIDTDKQTTQPTGKNIKAKLNELVAAAQDGDVLVFHFSGHGTQVPSDNNDEKDNKDEAICPCDMNVITDDDLRTILMPLAKKPGVKFTFIADCCHSGTILDHQAVVITGPKAGGPPPPPVDVAAIQSMLAALGAGGGGSGPNREMKNRALPFNDLLGFLSQMLGQPVSQGNVRSAMGSIFGADASNKVAQYMKYAEMAQKLMSGNKGAAGAAGGAGGMDIMSMICGCLGGGAAAGADQNSGGPGAAYAAPPPAAHAGAKPPADQQLPEEVGILISGCQDKETSADACPSGDPSEAHGALSNALQLAVKQHYANMPNQPLTYRNLVVSVREMLGKTGFTQNPCLECSDKWADAQFILH